MKKYFLLVARRWQILALVVALCYCVSGCAEIPGAQIQHDATAAISGSEPRKEAIKGFKALEKGRYDEASLHFNRAIKLDPTNSRLQFLNGFTYHLQAVQGDQSRFSLAEQGYQLARKFDPSNWLPSYYQGLLYLDQHHYKKAQEQLAEVLLFDNNNTNACYAMLVASYYAHDPATAAAMLTKLEATEGNTARVQQAGAMIGAATGQFDAADSYLADLTAGQGRKELTDYLSRRLGDWRELHENVAKSNSVIGSGQSIKGRMGGLRKISYQYNEQHSGSGETLDSDMETTEREKMIIVDVVIIRTEENITTSKGVNLLNGLSLQFGDSSSSAYRKTYDKDSSGEVTKTVSKLLTIPQVKYSLNIANSHADRNEILARPSLVALDGQMSEFFSGTHINAALVSSSSGGYGGSVQIEDDIGVQLQVTPELLDNDKVRLNVMAERTFLKTPSENIQFDNKVEKSKTRVSAYVEMSLNDTLILSGLSEKETERIRDGVPLLQSIPGIQYFFSQRTERDFQRSVLILLTPRLPEYVYSKRAQGRNSSAGNTRLDELKARYGDWFQPYPNWASVFHHLQSNSLYREFRTGDVSMERWESQSTLFENLKQALGFLYF